MSTDPTQPPTTTTPPQTEPGMMVTAEGTLEPAPTDAPAPIEAPPEPESLAEQVYRESHTIPESTGPSDYVPNRPNIRPPETVEEIVEEEAAEEDPLSSALASPERASAADLIAEAEAAQTHAELDAIEAQADGRVTVLDAVNQRRSEL